MDTLDKVSHWVSKALDSNIPAEVEALYINLVESPKDLTVELFGIGDFEPNDQDWACDDIYQCKSLVLKGFMQRCSGWEMALDEVSKKLREYLEVNAMKLTNIRRIGVGDSEIILIKNEL